MPYKLSQERLKLVQAWPINLLRCKIQDWMQLMVLKVRPRPRSSPAHLQHRTSLTGKYVRLDQVFKHVYTLMLGYLTIGPER